MFGKTHRKSIRLKGFNYSSRGCYYVTICTQNRICLFGNIVTGKMVLNAVGKLIDKWWLQIPNRFNNASLDIYQLMPNHLHGIVVINNPSVGAGFMPARTMGFMPAQLNRATTRVAPTTLGNVIGAFKSLTTHEYIHNVKNHHWPPFKKRLWQRNYYESIIRTEDDLHKIRQYITQNVTMWERDRNNPKQFLNPNS